MSTRSQIGFYPEKDTKLNKPDRLLYRHCDGYPEAMIPDLLPFLKSFNKYRGLSDTEYASARCIQWLCDLSDNHRSDFRKRIGSGDDPTPDYLSHGISDCLHCDIEYYYAVYPDRLEVYETSDGFWDARDKYKKMNLLDTKKLTK